MPGSPPISTEGYSWHSLSSWTLCWRWHAYSPHWERTQGIPRGFCPLRNRPVSLKGLAPSHPSRNAWGHGLHAQAVSLCPAVSHPYWGLVLNSGRLWIPRCGSSLLWLSSQSWRALAAFRHFHMTECWSGPSSISKCLEAHASLA